MFSFHSKYFVYRKLKRAPQILSFCFKCPDTGTVRILGNILYSIHFPAPNWQNIFSSTKPFVQFHYNVVYLVHFKKYNLQCVGSIRFTNQKFITCSQFQVTQDKGYTPWDRPTDDAWLYFGLISKKHKAT